LRVEKLDLIDRLARVLGEIGDIDLTFGQNDLREIGGCDTAGRKFIERLAVSFLAVCFKSVRAIDF
jgi:hypothetical protein